MGKIKIRVDDVLENAASIQNVANAVDGIKSSISSVSGRIDWKISERYNIGARLNSVVTQIGTAESRLRAIQAHPAVLIMMCSLQRRERICSRYRRRKREMTTYMTF